MLSLLLLTTAVVSGPATSDLPAALQLQLEGRFSQAEGVYRRILASRELTAAEEPKILNGLASVIFESGRAAEAEPLVRKAISIWEKSGETARVGAALNNLGAILRLEGKVQEAETAYLRSMSIFRTVHDEAGLAPVLTNLGTMYAMDRGRYAEAETLLREAVSIRQRLGDSADPALGNSYAALAQALQAAGRAREAEEFFGRALSWHERTLRPGHPQVARDRANLAYLFRCTNRLVEAEALYLRALVDFESALGKLHPDYAATLNNIGQVRSAVGDLKAAQALYRQAISIWERALGPDHPCVAAGLANLAEALRALHHYDDALKMARRALLIDETKLGSGHPRTADDHELAGNLSVTRKKYSEAQMHFETAIAIKTKLYGKASADAAEVRASLAELFRVTKRGPQSVAAFREAVAVLEKAWHPDDLRLLRILNNYEQALRAEEEFAEAERVGVWSTRIQVRQALLDVRSH